MAKFILIRPPHIYPKTAITIRAAGSPLGLAYIAGALQDSGHQVRVIDAVGLNIDVRWPTDFPGFEGTGLTLDEIFNLMPNEFDAVGISCMFSTDWKHTKQLIKRLRETYPKKLIILGGEQVSAVSEYSLTSTNADLVVVGEGEETIVDIGNKLDLGLTHFGIEGTVSYDSNTKTICTNPRRKRIKKLDEIAKPAWSLFPIDSYLAKGTGTSFWDKRRISMIMSRGCPYQCTFCTSPQMWGTSWVPRNADCVISEIKGWIEKFRINHVEFYDLTAVVNKKWTIEFTTKLIEANLNITWTMPSGTRSEVLDKEVLTLMKRSGCSSFAYAPESGSERMLKKIKKKINKKKMLRSISICNKIGILSRANMIIGFPGEKHWDIWLSIWFMVRMAYAGIWDVSLALYCPMPGVELYEEIKARYDNDDDIENIWMEGIDTNYFNPKSYSENVSDVAIGIYAFLSLSIFYSSQFIFRPWRIYIIIKNVIVNKPQTVLESFLHNKIMGYSVQR